MKEKLRLNSPLSSYVLNATNAETADEIDHEVCYPVPPGDDQIVAVRWGALRRLTDPRPPIPMVLHCPDCHKRHIDEGEFATKPHTTHACQHCGFVWKPSLLPTVGVQFLEGYKNE